MTAPRLEIDLDKIVHNTRTLVERLAPRGIRVIGVTKASLGSPDVAAAMLRGGAHGLGDSRVENLLTIRAAGIVAPLTLIRTPMLSQADSIVHNADISFNTEAVVLDALSSAAEGLDRAHAVVLMVELGDLREGVAVADVVALARRVGTRPGLVLVGLGTNLACQSGVVPDQTKMEDLSRLIDQLEVASGVDMPVVSGGNSANLQWAMSTVDVGRVNELRLGESILLGTEPLHRQPIDGLYDDAFTLVAEVIEAKIKPAKPWGTIGQTAFGRQPARHGNGFIHQAIVAVGRQDIDPDGLTPPPGISLLGASSDHLVLDTDDIDLHAGDEVAFGLDYSALIRAMSSPYVTKVFTAVPTAA